jgi:hypothetical protein
MWAVFVLEKRPGTRWDDEDWEEDPIDIFSSKVEASRCASEQPKDHNRRVVLRHENLRMESHP